MNANANQRPPVQLGWHDAESAAFKLASALKKKVTKQDLLKAMRENQWLKDDPIGSVHGGIHNLPTADALKTKLFKTEDRTYHTKGTTKIYKTYKVVLINYKALSLLKKLLLGEEVNLQKHINTSKTQATNIKKSAPTKKDLAARDKFLANLGIETH